MNQARFPLLLAFALLLGAAAASDSPPVKNNRALFSLWARIQEPLAGEPKPIGTYAAGCLAGAQKLPLDGTGYSVMRPSRHRYYGHPNLISFIEKLGKSMHEFDLPLLLVGDMGRPRGGPMPTGHSSHQIGLDVDLWFRMSRKRPSNKERETWSAENFVKGDKSVTKHWGDKERKLMQLAASSPLVDRIFVHPAIKRDLCERFQGSSWLYKMRPWWAHQDHLHVRLTCPDGESSCKPQPPLDSKDPQCGKELDWWFSAEAKEEGAKKEAAFKDRPFPDLPEDCGKMVQELKVGLE